MKQVFFTLLALAGTIYACKSPIENVDVGLKTALATSVEVRFKPQSGVSPESVKVRITGPDADKVVTILNTKNFRVDEDGILRLATVASVAPGAEHPIQFTVVATADDFLEVVQPVTLSDNNQRTVPITMLGNKATALIVQTTAQSDASGSLRNALTIQTTAASVIAQAAVSIPQGTRLKDVMGQPVDGDLVVRMQPLTVHSATDLPDGGMLAETSATGQIIGSQQLTDVAGAVTLEIHNSDYQTVKTFSSPIRLAFAVNSGTVDPATNEPIKHGDSIPMFSYDAATDRWQQETDGLIQTNSRTGQLECIAQVSHLSTWTAAHKKPSCGDDDDEGTTFNVKSSFKNYDVPFYCQVVYVDKKGKDVEVASSFYRDLIDGSEIAVTNLKPDRFVRLKVYENPADLTKFIASSTIKSCGEGKTNLDVRSLKIPAAARVMTFTIQFPCKNVDEKALPERVPAQYRETGTSVWQDLISLNRKDIKGDRLQGGTYRVTKGKRYDLRVKVLGFNFEQPNQLIDKDDWLVKFRGKDFCKK